MNSRKLGLLIFGVILLLAGIVFSLQGADIITGSQLMSGNSTYIYVGAVVAVIGLVLLALGSRVGKLSTSSAPAGQSQPAE